MREPDAGRRSAAKADPGDRRRAEGEGLKAEGRRRTGANAEPGGTGAQGEL